MQSCFLLWRRSTEGYTFVISGLLGETMANCTVPDRLYAWHGQMASKSGTLMGITVVSYDVALLGNDSLNTRPDHGGLVT